MKKTSVKDIYKDRDSQIEAIESTFEAATKTIPGMRCRDEISSSLKCAGLNKVQLSEIK